MSQIQQPTDLSALNTAIAAHERAQRYAELMRMPGAVDRMMEALANLDRFLSAVYPIETDYGMPGENPDRHYEELFCSLVTAGNYGYVNPNFIYQNFPLRRLTGIVREELLLFDFGREIESDEVVATMPRFLTEPPLIDHCLAFGIQHPRVQEQNPVVFLGSVWSGGVLFLGRWHGERELRLGARRGRWRRRCRFAALRKVLPNPAP